MPEGDTVFLTGALVGRALTGRTLTRTDFRVPSLATADLAGSEFAGVRTVGKHLFFRFRGVPHGSRRRADGAGRELSLHSHLRMDGAWRTYPSGRRWGVPAHQVRVVLAAGDVETVGVRVHDLALLSTSDEHRWVGRLGPDLLDPEWTDDHTARAVAALTADPGREIGSALLDQTAVAGIGNLYKVEICFRLGVTPWTPVSDVDVAAAVALARRLLRANATRWEQSTTGDLARGRRTWVYERTRQGCFRCGGPVRVADQGAGIERRPTWFCPRCQHGPVPHR
ncbi:MULTISPECIES: DNA-formamidopyrimidine glycosylase family protein [Prauserella salsuginis group]|uniref:DNA-(apurinic or apyrimidinic site) lyase n=2 Tax=Prauserella salsuginis group TaxID=2893672 RepID=A0A839XYG2_9PSEU|nr:MULTISPECIES: DNA-formamidopyrimidine glycosylase family protein [Prauserella salsuginis group]MBB3665056.1 endonuclease-8 [Prauserella sediminis]MCR3718527.1 endonuclease-8 [Prauserella flava]MCR3733097.1 endonuclease-8 [Prauserella salsuginis]